jgi:hypothetical protein
VPSRGGVSALFEQKRGPRNLHPNRLAAEIEAKILDYALHWPWHGQHASRRSFGWVSISPSGRARGMAAA